MLTTFVVDTLADGPVVLDGQLTLREAIVAANTDQAAGDAVAGDGADAIRFSQSALSEFSPDDPTLQGGIQLTAGELVVTDELDLDGGGVLISANGQGHRVMSSTAALSLSNLTLAGGEADVGGGLRLAGDAVSRLTDVVLTSNRAESGGGLANDQVTFVSGGLISGNTARQGGGVLNTGALSVRGGGLVGNTALRERVDIELPGGGGGLATTSGSSTVLRGVTVQDNLTNTIGGGVSTTGGLTVEGGSFSGNVAELVRTADGGADWNGGGIAATEGATLRVVGTTFDANAVNGGGGPAIYVGGLLSEEPTVASAAVIDSVFTANAAFGGGAIVAAGYAPLDVRGSVFTGNRGGAVTASGVRSFDDANSFVRIADSLFFDNTDSFGGALSLVNGELVRVSARGNVADDRGGFLHVRGDVTIDASVIRDNSALIGGGVWLNSGSLTITDSSVRGNTTTGSPFGGAGGAIQVDSGDLTIAGSYLRDNASATSGGVISVAADVGPASVSITGSFLYRNRAGGSGGVLDATDTPIQIAGSLLADNAAADSGGAVYTAGRLGSTAIVGSVARGNSAGDGGGVFSSTPLTLRDSSIKNNTATGNGGGIDARGPLSVAGSVLAANVAARGGGIAAGGFSVLEGSNVRGNAATLGGGLYLAGDVTLGLGLNVINNRADTGGGIYVAADGTARLAGVLFADNDPDDSAGPGEII